MQQTNSKLQSMPEWHALQNHFEQTKNHHMRDAFDEDPDRFEKFSLKLDDILFDFSKNRISHDTLKLLSNLANACQLNEKIQAMFSGEKINITEQRAVLHSALRYQGNDSLMVDGQDIYKLIDKELNKAKELSEKIRNQQWLGATNKPITNIVNIGIGGSHLGPQMVTEALKPFVHKNLIMHFIANLDENEIDDTLSELNPETTLFIICSKSFTTQETMYNALTARKWFLNQIPDEAQLGKHFVAVSTNLKAVEEFGIDKNNTFAMWDWVGGRYSLWSAIGLSVMIAIGYDGFMKLLKGAFEVDQHFKSTPLDKNIPVIMAMLGVWYNNFYQSQSAAVLPYPQHLHRFPSFLQQADMESNGKYVSINGENIDHDSGPIIFGELGNPGQHAFYQLLHQGTKLVPIDIIASASNVSGERKHHDALMSNLLAQAEALMRGKTEQEVIDELTSMGLEKDSIESLTPHKIFPGNRPSNTIFIKKLDPKSLGSLIALYEHKIFVQGVIWNINSFDQWGVELGKQLAKTILSELESDDSSCSSHDSSTTGLMDYYRKYR